MMTSSSISSSEEGRASWSTWIRWVHRWLSIAFTAAVIVTSVALAREQPVEWMTYLPLPPLGLLWFTGMYLFVLPYATKWRSKRRNSNMGRAGH